MCAAAAAAAAALHGAAAITYNRTGFVLFLSFFYFTLAVCQMKHRLGEDQLFTVDACRLCFCSTHAPSVHLRLSSCCCFLEISTTGRTLSREELCEREASGLPGQRTGSDI